LQATDPSSRQAAGQLRVAKALELAANESSALGTTFIGTEHLLLGLIGEPDGVAGHVLRSLGADLRVSRRTVAAALAGWDARAAHQPQREDEASRQADGVAAIVRAELAPVLARIARLESRGTG
jgi:ATP-dependent Clp protease ATP-binding subunit ClpC